MKKYKYACSIKSLPASVRCFLIIGIFLLGIFPSALVAQTIIVKGQVTNSQEPLAAVSVNVKGSTTNVVTDSEGFYSIEAKPKSVLVFSFVGMETKEIMVNSQSVINVRMNENIISLGEVVAIGYGVKKKIDLSGAVGSVSGKDLSKLNVVSFDKALTGRLAGVSAISNSGQPGGNVSVRIRGVGNINNSEPLYVIDGVIINAGANAGMPGSDMENPLSSIDPADIVSIDVLKDAASAAIYGTRGANGVMIVTTKRGHNGKLKVNYSGSHAIQKAIYNVTPLNGTQFAQMINETMVNAGKPAIFSNPDSIGAGTDWVDAIMRTGKVDNHTLSIEGGNDKHNFYLGMNYYRNEGILINSFYDRFGLRFNSDNQLSNRIKVGNSMAISTSSNATERNDGILLSAAGPINAAYWYPPVYTIYNKDGSYAGPTNALLERIRNPVANLNSLNYDNRRFTITGNVYTEVDLMKGLKFKSTISVDAGYSSNSSFSPSYNEALTTNNYSSINKGNGYLWSWIWDNVLTYSKSFGRHNLSIMGGTSASNSHGRSMSATEGYDLNQLTEISGTGTAFTSSSGIYIESLSSIFGRGSYDYKGKYLLEANIRQDGSSKFGPNNKFAVFPSFSGGWRISEEPFFPKGSINNMKIRGSWGQVGVDPQPPFRYLAGLSSAYLYPLNDGAGYQGVISQELANPNMKWATSEDYDIGVDMTLLHSKVSFTFDYYKKKIKDMLIQVNLPNTSGLSNVWRNAGEVENSGLEFSAGYHDHFGGVRMNVNANLSTIKNRVIALAPDAGLLNLYPGQFNGENVTVITAGQPLGSFIGYETEGIFQTQADVDAANNIDGDPTSPYQSTGTAPGDFKYKDLNGDGKIDNNDRTIIGNPVPDFIYGLSVDLGYKNFDFSLLGNGSYGGDIYNLNRTSYIATGRTFNKTTEFLNRWHGAGTSNTVPRAQLNDPNRNTRASSAYVEKGNFFKIRNIQLGYTFKNGILSKGKISNIRVFASVDNVWTISKYSGPNPEIGTVHGNNGNSRLDIDIYPEATTFTVGINLNF